jgi:hypothetical protein
LEKVVQKRWLPQVSRHPTGENSPNLVTLIKKKVFSKFLLSEQGRPRSKKRLDTANPFNIRSYCWLYSLVLVDAKEKYPFLIFVLYSPVVRIIISLQRRETSTVDIYECR